MSAGRLNSLNRFAGRHADTVMATAACCYQVWDRGAAK